MEQSRVVVVGAGFAGFECVRRLEKSLSPHDADITLVSPGGYMLYLPLLPHVAAGVISSRSIAVPLYRMLKRTHIVPGGAIGVDLDAKVCVVRKITGEVVNLPYDQIVICPGSVTRTFDIPGLDKYGRGMKNLAEAVALRDHVIAQLELANSSTDESERRARCQFVVVGGGYAGVETAACLEMVTSSALDHFPRLDPSQLRWTVVDLAPRLMPELGENLGRAALEILAKRGVDVRLETSVNEVTEDTVTLTTGQVLPCRTLVWTAGVAPSPLIATLGAETVRGRLAVGADLAVPGRPDVFGMGDAAAVPDLDKGDGAVCPPTAQYAMRQARIAAHNVVAAIKGKPYSRFRHKDLGLVVDLGGTEAVARPLGRELRGLPAQAITRGYHLMALPSLRARARVGAGWAMHAVAGDDFIRLGFLAGRTGALSDYEHRTAYLSRDEVAAQARRDGD
ncbi:NAD(P)/FAD-dependent oxidoreductase [Yinghuangia seranimata]|uniref:NAD(P)/FAD-dependent oxidoreductase n=1 Tax=Yinghuangia seranimata TaxID=408067 RepID=UPI00248D1325|nr:FAD-dependent oxidoreductase [Yinghuangia seranimata]MDI2124865.1 FAD-dependent oxidoreductase [Yinghuangia seranimata]